MFLNGYPYSDFHELNLDFLLKSMDELKKAFKNFTASNSLIFAEPLLHDLTKSYAKNTIVLDPDGNAYISLQIVPEGVQLSNTDYWLMVFDFQGYVERANKNFTNNYFSDIDRAPYALSVNDWVVLDDVLYKVTQAIAVDELFEVGTNLVHFTVEQFLKDFVTSVNNTLAEYSLTIQQYKNDIDASELAYRQQLAQDIADTTASLQAQLTLAISGVTVDSEVINARVGYNGETYLTLGDAVRGQVSDINEILLTVKNTQTYTSTAAGYKVSYFKFVSGHTYIIKNEGAAGMASVSTYDNGAVVETISPSLAPGLSVSFTATANASQIRFYFNQADVSISIKEMGTDIEEIFSDLTELDDKIDDVDSYIPDYSLTYPSFDCFNFTRGAYISKSGINTSYSGGKYTDFIPVPKGTSISVSMKCISNTSVAVAFYDSTKTFDLSKSIWSLDGPSGTIITVTDSITTDEDGFIRIGRQIADSSGDTITMIVPKTIADVFNKCPYQWNGKKWYCFGTSLTDNEFPNATDNNNPTGKYTNYLSYLSGLAQVNEGIAGGTIGNGGPYNSSGSILTRILATDVSDGDLITLEGFINDVTADRPLGSQATTSDTTTLWGAVGTAIEHLASNSDALVVLISTSLGKPYTMPDNTHPNYGTTYRNGLGLSIADYNEELRKIAAYYNVPFIDAGGKSMINEFHPDFIIDQIHHSILGGEQYAETIWSELKNMQPLKK